MRTQFISPRLLLIGCSLLPLWLSAQGPTSTENYVQTKVARVEAGTETAFNGLNSTDQSAVSISYVDGLGL